MASSQDSNAQAGRKKGPKLTKDGKITVFDAEEKNYGIRELIDLIRYIPEGQDIFFGAEMIKKTLASMQLSITDIMQDAVDKKKLASKTIQHLVTEISDYQRRIQSLKSHIRHLRFELGEIQDSCHYLLSNDEDLNNFTAVLDEVPRSPIEGDETMDSDDKPAKQIQSTNKATPPAMADSEETPVPTLEDSPSLEKNPTPAESSNQHTQPTTDTKHHQETTIDAFRQNDVDETAFESSETLVADLDEDGIIEALDKEPGFSESSLAEALQKSDRFDDQNGLNTNPDEEIENYTPASQYSKAPQNQPPEQSSTLTDDYDLNNNDSNSNDSNHHDVNHNDLDDDDSDDQDLASKI